MFVAGRITQFILLVAVFCLLMFLVQRAKRGKAPKIRKLPGLDAIEEAVGRATEMGRPTHVTTGFGHYGLTNPTYAPQLLAGLSVLGYVTRLAAKRRTPVIATLAHPEMLALYEDVMKQAYLAEGVPDDFRPDSIRFLSSYQFAYAAGVMEVLANDKVASNIMIGSFMAESLLFAEAGSSTGCVQIAGTANITQLPFFAGICDYTLIGEDIFAAGAYVSSDPVLVSSIAGQDITKVSMLVLILSLVTLMTLKIDLLTKLLRT